LLKYLFYYLLLSLWLSTLFFTISFIPTHVFIPYSILPLTWCPPPSPSLVQFYKSTQHPIRLAHALGLKWNGTTYRSVHNLQPISSYGDLCIKHSACPAIIPTRPVVSSMAIWILQKLTTMLKAVLYEDTVLSFDLLSTNNYFGSLFCSFLSPF
jgi:hypothetical protein